MLKRSKLKFNVKKWSINSIRLFQIAKALRVLWEKVYCRQTTTGGTRITPQDDVFKSYLLDFQTITRYCCCSFAFLELSPLTRTTQFR
jgi:hypothetical protein